MKLTFIFKLFIIGLIGLLFACKTKMMDKTNKESFEEILNDSRINSKEVGEREGIKYFQIMKNDKMGFRDLDGKIVIEPIYDMAEMFSEGYSTVQVGDKWGLIDETGKYIIEPKFEFLGSVHCGLLSYRVNNKYGFVNIGGQEKIKAQFDWVGEFSEGLCVVRNDYGMVGSSYHLGKCGYIDMDGKLVLDFKYRYAGEFKNGKAKVSIDKDFDFVIIDKTGKIIESLESK